ncbi:MAG: N-acetylmuramoyl-L-alanine amidase family protein [Armatimonadota bacterium]|nr:N-acetylmuramoyl-L-alanine amidase family protein [Armatimonadota bacterium]MDR7466692.1 N-acetylmuramoyl-L-alanine amidase family protein [Armatimonadota bacterium]MDR7492834.1 N-acetylmuramoyl-L-alanine amidase family protein [Armatimonadota bacterium]MDR7504574.1 N-acetylmuramoyl-L-alanine amidase family protein [Armatimonadota bacterium]MDR7546941.1 N-acetylmuramoyl-L-alanine amidase family protein [Armatimonadota bacterium]
MATAVLAALAVAACAAAAPAQDVGIKVVVNGVDVPLAAPAVVVQGQVLAPISGLFEPMGAIAAYYETDRSVVVTNRTRAALRLFIGQPTLQVDGKVRPLPVSPQVIRGLAYIPLQAVFSALGAWTKYEPGERTLYVSSQITAVSARVASGVLLVQVEATGPVQTETLVLTDPDRMVVDFLHAALRTPPGETPVNDAGVQRIRTAQFQVKPYVSRLVFDLQAPVDIRVVSDPLSYLVTLEIRPKAAAGAPPPGPPPGAPLPGPPSAARSTEPGVSPPTAGALRVTGVTFRRDGAGGRITVEGDGPMEYRIREFVFPDRLAIDIENAVFVPVKEEVRLEHPSIVSVRAAQFTAQPPVARVVVTLKRKMNYFVSRTPSGLIIDVNTQTALRRHIVAIDPGHGGRDPGAIGPSGLREADVVLDIARRVRELLERDGVRVVMTRDDDATVELTERPRMAREAGASIYVSIHANAHGRATANGSETYYLTPQSLALAQMIQDELGIVLSLPSRGIKTANFLVLRDSSVPSVLVETAFISNAEDEARLRDAAFRQRLAQAIHRGIMRFLTIYPAPAP